jgi:hypothetical protein
MHNRAHIILQVRPPYSPSFKATRPHYVAAPVSESNNTHGCWFQATWQNRKVLQNVLWSFERGLSSNESLLYHGAMPIILAGRGRNVGGA